jgi:translation initiation factor IF-3
VVKIDDFRTFLGKRLPPRRGRRNSGQDLKEIRLKPFVGTHDLEVKLNRMEEFLGEGNKVKVTISFFGRAITHKDLGKKLMEKIVAHFEEKAKLEAGPSFKGRRLYAVFVPKK